MPQRVKDLQHRVMSLLQIVVSCIELDRIPQAMEALDEVCAASKELREQLATAKFGGGFSAST